MLANKCQYNRKEASYNYGIRRTDLMSILSCPKARKNLGKVHTYIRQIIPDQCCTSGQKNKNTLMACREMRFSDMQVC